METATPTKYIQPELETFKTLMDALDASVMNDTGLNFYSARGDLIEVVPYKKLRLEARDFGSRLLGQGLQKRERVGIVAETEADFVRAFMGCLYAQLVPCPLPLPTAFGASDAYAHHLLDILAVADASAVIIGEEYRDLVIDHFKEDDFRFIGPFSALGETREPLPDTTTDEDELAYLQFSSGTTNNPKGIAVSHRAVMANITTMVKGALKLGPNDRGMSWLPFYHDMGLVGCMLLPIVSHMSMDFLSTRDFIRRPGLWTTLVSRAKATISYAPSFGYGLAARRLPKAVDLDLSHWRIAGIGGDMIRSDNLDSFAAAFESFGFNKKSFLPSYGMAEAALGVTFGYLDHGHQVEHISSAGLESGQATLVPSTDPDARQFMRCGVILPGHELEIRGHDNQILPDRTIGKVYLRGPSIMIGYYDNKAETDKMLDAEKWLNTGDLGYLIDGELVLTGRSKDLIIVNGRNIWPQDMEWLIEESVDGVRNDRVAAFAAESKNNSDEEQVVIVVECRILDSQEKENFRDLIHKRIKSAFGITPHVVLSRSVNLPRTSSGKLSRAKTRKMYSEGLFDA